jgi:putative ABC transport system permease protein
VEISRCMKKPFRKMKRINIFQLAWKNLRRKVIRTLLLLLAVALVTGTLFSASIFISGMENALKIGTYRLGADILVVPAANEEEARTALLAGKPTSFYMDRDVYKKVLAVDGVQQASPQLFIKPSTFTCCFSVDVFLVAFDPETDFTIRPWLKKNLRGPLLEDEVIAGRTMPVIIGMQIPFFGTTFTVVGNMEPTGMKFFDQSVFMTMDAAYKMAEDSKTKSLEPLTLDRGKISAVLVKADPDISPDRVAIRITHDIDGVKAIASDEVINTVRRQLGGLMKGIVAISGVLWAFSLLMLGFAFYMIVNERQRELGLLRAMGALRRQIFSLIMLEAVMITAAGGIVGLGIGTILLFSLKGMILGYLKLPYLLPDIPVLQGLIAGAIIFAILTGLLASLLPAALASKLEPYEAIRQGE